MPPDTASSLHVRAWRPVGPSLSGAALLVHGAESHGGWFAGVGRQLAGRGLLAVAYDRQGWGQSPGARGRLASADEALAELAWMAARLRDLAGGIHLVGLSWGGLLAAVARGRLGEGLASVTLVAPALRPLKRPSHGQLVKLAFGGMAGLPLVPADFTASEEQQRGIAEDPYRVTAVDRGFCLATLELQAELADAPVLGVPLQLLLAEQDRVIDGDYARRWVEARGGSVRTVSGTRHSLPLEAPEAVAAAVRDLAAAPGGARAISHAS